MTVPSKRSVLRCLSKPRLAALVEQYDVEIAPRSASAKLLDALARAHKPTMADLLDALDRGELEQVCREHELDARARSKAELIARIVAPPNVAARERVSAAVAREVQSDRQLSLLAEPTPATATVMQTPVPPLPAVDTTPTPAAEIRTFKSFSEIASFIWGVADLLRGDYKAHEYGQVILPFTVLRRLDQVLAPTREAVQQADRRYADKPEAVRERFLLRAATGSSRTR